MKIKFSKKLKWLGIGAGLTILTTAVAAPVLVSCSNDNGSGGSTEDNGGGQNPGGGSGTVVEPPFSVVDSNNIDAVGALSNAYNISSSAKSFGTATTDVLDGTNKLIVNTASNGNANTTFVSSFTTAVNTEKNGFALNMTLTSDTVKYVGFGQYNANTASSALPGDNQDAAKKFLFGKGTTSSFLSSDWLSKNESPNEIFWVIDEEKQKNELTNNPDTTLELKEEKTNDFGLGANKPIFYNAKKLEWKATDPAKDETLIKTGYVILKLRYNTQDDFREISVPINFNVIYNYKGQESSQQISAFDPNVNFDKTTGVDVKDNVGDTYSADAKSWIGALGSTSENPILNIGLNQQSKYVKFKLTATDLVSNTANESIISHKWLKDKKLVLSSNSNVDNTKLDIWFELAPGSENNLGLLINEDGSIEVGSNTPLNWDSNITKNTRTLTQANFNGRSQFSTYLETKINLVISPKTDLMTNEKVTLPITLRYVAPCSPIIENKNLLDVTPDFVKGNSSDIYHGLQAKAGDSVYFSFTNNVATLKVNLQRSQYLSTVTINKPTKDETINYIINNDWFSQSGFTTNAEIEWMLAKNQPDIQNNVQLMPAIDGSNYTALVSTLMNGSENSVLFNSVMNLKISEGDKTIFIPINLEFTSSPITSFEANAKTKTDITSGNTLFYSSDVQPGVNINQVNNKLQYEFGTQPDSATLGINLTLNIVNSFDKFVNAKLPSFSELTSSDIWASTPISNNMENFYGMNEKNTKLTWSINSQSTPIIPQGLKINQNLNTNDLWIYSSEKFSSSASFLSSKINLFATFEKDDGTKVQFQVTLGFKAVAGLS